MIRPGNKLEMIEGLRRASDPAAQWSCLEACRKIPLQSPGILKRYHDALLYVCAYPFSAAAYRQATDELHRLAVITGKYQYNSKWQVALSGSGLPFSGIYCQYSASLVNWLLEKYPANVQAAETGVTPEDFQSVCRSLLPGVEFYTVSEGKVNMWSRLKLLSGHSCKKEALKWFLQVLKQQSPNPVTSEYLYDALKIFISWSLKDDGWCRSFLRAPAGKLFTRRKRAGGINTGKFIRRKPIKACRLNKMERENLVSVMRTSLAFMMRETDPVTYAHSGETFLFDMGEGLRIALTGMDADHRLSMESYVGYMAFKNGVPVAYGGGWIFGYHCKIGINLYSPFRGGESAKIFCQVLRLYFQRFRARTFIVKPYQFGKDNMEGLKSGAFWFYYKLGFRPASKQVAAMASAEWKKIREERPYRSSLSRLKELAVDAICYQPVKDDIFHPDAGIISQAITRMIIQRFRGNREKAIAAGMRYLRSMTGYPRPGLAEPEKKAWQNWSLVFLMLPGTQQWTASQLKKFCRIVTLKAGGKERDFVLALQQHSAFLSSIHKLLVKG